MASAGDDDLDIPLEETNRLKDLGPSVSGLITSPNLASAYLLHSSGFQSPVPAVRPEALGQLPGAFDQAPTRASRPTRLPTLIFLRQILRRRRLRTQTRLQAPRPPILHRRLPAMAPHLRAPILHRRHSGLQSCTIASRLWRRTFELQSATAASRPWRRTFELQSATAASRPWRRTFELQSATAASRPGRRAFGLQSSTGSCFWLGLAKSTPPNQRTPPTGSKRKQTDDRPNSSPRSQRRRTQNASTPKSPTTKRKKGGPKTGQSPVMRYQRRQRDYRALHLHLRILMGLLSQRDVPTRLSADAMAPFEARFACADDVDAQLSEILAAAIPPTSAIRQQVTDFLKTAKAAGTQTGADAHRVGEDHLRSIFNTVANAALPYFAPDVFGNPESMYNLAHEHIAIHSFRRRCHAIRDQHLLQRFYRSFIYGHMKTLAAKEERRPGRVELDVVLNAIYRRREETLSMRQEQIIRDCFMNGFVMKLAAERECHSDDEEADDVGVSRVHEKPGRDGAVSALFGVLDARRDPAIANGYFSFNLSRALPTTVPIDYFSPKFFNDLSVWDPMAESINGRLYGQVRQRQLALYNIPTEDELAMLASMDEDD
ncbi:hypothetical protein B0H13DRAFT_1883704 [Mycena leptocephala]|nr:hypothetical protein B0H13DRAFT_1883704 [Mycena leptocephala]